MKGTHEQKDEVQPTMEDLHNPYVLQLIAALSKSDDRVEELDTVIKERIGADHYGPYGTACMFTGQFDAGECWLCYARRKTQEAAEMQLVAGRYQYMHEQAQKALNSIDDFFEYAFKTVSNGTIQTEVRKHLATYTGAVAKVNKPKQGEKI